jgi:hypothetical protein
MRAERHRQLSLMLDAALECYEWLSGNGLGIETAVRELILGELAYLRTSTTKLLGRRKESVAWNRVARRHFLNVPANLPLRAKVATMRMIDAYLRHRRVSFAKRCDKLTTLLSGFGMLNEVVACEVSVAFAEKTVGRDRESILRLERLEKTYRDSNLLTMRAVILANLADALVTVGEVSRVSALLEDALEAAVTSGCEFLIGSVMMTVAIVRIDQGRVIDSIAELRDAIWKMRRAGDGGWVAYHEVSFAEALVNCGEWREARQIVLHALPILRDEEMTEETVHALKVLQDADRLAGRRPRLRFGDPE